IKNTPYWITLNGKTLDQPVEGALQLQGLKNLDISSILKAGNNVIAFKSQYGEPGGNWMSVEGIIFCDNGTTIRILTDGWKGGWNLAEGWDDPKQNPEGLKSIQPGAEPLKDFPHSVYPHPYYGPIQVQAVGIPGYITFNQPIFDETQKAQLNITLLNMKESISGDTELWAETFDESERKSVSRKKINLSPQGNLDLSGTLDLGKLSKGAYKVRFILANESQELESRDYEVVSVGKIEQPPVEGTHYEEGLDLKEVWSIDCTEESGPGSFVASRTVWRGGNENWKELETEVKDGPAGKYRVLKDNEDYVYFAYKYKVQNLYAPHLAVVEFPDDAKRNFIVHIKEPGSGTPFVNDSTVGFQRSEAGWNTDHDRFPERSNEMKKIHLLFWPNSREGSIHICNVKGGEAPAAAARIKFYEITNDLPALSIKDAGDHMIGPHTERGPYTLASSYYSGPLGSYFVERLGIKDHQGFYNNWYNTTQNLIKRMNFSGQNLYLMGHFMYNSTLYPSELYRWGYFQNSYHGGDVVRDNVGLILRMFEKNNITMISGVEHFTVDILKKGQPTPEQIRAGVEHKFMVTREGTLFPIHAVRHKDGHWTGSGRPLPDGSVRWPAQNYFHPEIQGRFLAIIDDLVRLYAEYPAWKGIAFILSRCMGPMEVAHLHSKEIPGAGFEDYTIDLFEKETGIHIPVNKRDPDRFEKRYQWIKKNIEEQWITWRCAKYTDFLKRILDRVSGGRPDVKLHLVIAEPMLWEGSQEILDGHYEDSTFLVNLLKKFGFDLPKLQNEPRIVLTPIYALAGSHEADYTRGHQGWRELTQNHMWQSMFADNARGGAYIKGNIPHYGAYTYPEGRWLFSSAGTYQGWLWSTYVTETLVNVMSRSNPTWMPHTWMDICESMGRIHEQRIFARAYRTLPNALYDHLTGNGLDKNIWISQTRTGGDKFAYASNQHWWEPKVTIKFSEGSKVRDLIKDKPLRLDDNTWTFTMA
ncbi:hypothetical protein ACFLSA_06715, partial [Bacteroidota bacterium]